MTARPCGHVSTLGGIFSRVCTVHRHLHRQYRF